jgi:AcrR family transcriptional regulator
MPPFGKEKLHMPAPETLTHLQPPKRADARRNYEQLVEAARGVFAEAGSSASLEEIARRAGVGIGTLYRHFPTRQALLEAVYVDEVEALSRAAGELADLPPWEALTAWLRNYVSYATTKRALAEELSASVGAETTVFQSCKGAIFAAGEPLLERAQAAGVVRADTNFTDIARMVFGIAAIPASEPEQIQRILDVALDGLRYQPSR